MPQCMLGYTPQADTPRAGIPRADTTQADPPPPPADGYCSGRYASYWNAFLFVAIFKLSACIISYWFTSLLPAHWQTVLEPRRLNGILRSILFWENDEA